jgi:type VII secretion integral membrane protein EccD
VHQTLETRQSSEPRPTGEALRRVSVHADSIHVDLVLSAVEPIASLMPPIVDTLAAQRGYRTQPMAVRHQLSLPGRTALDPSKTLTQLGVRDGAVLMLTSSSTVLTPTRFDDVAEAVSVSLSATVRPLTRKAARLIGAVVASGLAGSAAAVLIRKAFDISDARRAGCAAVAAAAGLIALLAAVIAYRMFRDRAASLMLGLTACGFAAIAGLLAVRGEIGAPNALLAAAATATVAAAMRITGCCKTVFTALACFAALETGASMVSAVTGMALQAIGAVSAAISLILIELSAPVSIILAGLSSEMTSEHEEAASTRHRLSARAIRAHSSLTSLVAAFSAAAALGAIGAAAGSYVAGDRASLGLWFAAITGGVLLLRARSHRDLTRSVQLMLAGTATLSATFVVAAVAYPSRTPYLAAASMTLAAAALCLGFITRPMTFSPIGRRSVDLLEYLALAVIVPLACWICGAYSTARGMNLL